MRLQESKQIPRKRSRKEVFSQAHLCLYNPPSQHALMSNLRNFYEKREIGVASTTFPTPNVKLISLLRILKHSFGLILFISLKVTSKLNEWPKLQYIDKSLTTPHKDRCCLYTLSPYHHKEVVSHLYCALSLYPVEYEYKILNIFVGFQHVTFNMFCNLH